MTVRNVTFSKVKRLYPNHTIIGVKEAWMEGIGWFRTVNGEKIDEQGTTEQQILFCQAVGATNVQLHLEGQFYGLTHKTFADYKISELIKQ